MMINPGFTPHSTVLISHVFVRFLTCHCALLACPPTSSPCLSVFLARFCAFLRVLASICVSSRVFACPRTLYMPLSDALSHTRVLYYGPLHVFCMCFLAPPRNFACPRVPCMHLCIHASHTV